VDPADGRVLGAYQASALPRWVKNLHRAFLLGDAGRWGAAGVALGLGLLCASGLVLLLRRMGGWRHMAGRVRGTLAQRIHVVAGRVVLVVLWFALFGVFRYRVRSWVARWVCGGSYF
jgi:sulfite reductase (NADPH) flavoprotein alpha-component